MNNKYIKKMFDNKINKQNNYNEILRKRERMKKSSLFKILVPACSLALIMGVKVLNVINNSNNNSSNNISESYENTIVVN